MMEKLRLRFAAFMQDRYGPDALYKALFVASLVLIVLNLLFQFPVFYLLGLALIAWSFFRIFSKDRAKRAAENQKYLTLKDKAQKRAMLLVNRFKYMKTHRYRTCPSCKTPLRLAKKTGSVHVKCPVCRNEFDVNIRF